MTRTEKLRAALSALVYLEGGRWFTCIHGDWDVSDIVGDALDPTEQAEAVAARTGGRLDAEFDILVDGVIEASTSGPHADAYREAMHYAEQYREDGDVLVVERVPVARLPQRVRS